MPRDGLRARGVSVIERCRIQGNSFMGAFLDNAASTILRDCVISGNVNAGVRAYQCPYALIENCTIASNHAPLGNGAGVQVRGSSVEVVRSIIWGNCGDADGWEIASTLGATLLVSCSNVEASLIAPPGGSGTHTLQDLLELDPLLCSPADCSSAPTVTGFYGLPPGSPALSQSCGPMGAMQPLCSATGLTGASWGKVKAGYR